MIIPYLLDSNLHLYFCTKFKSLYFRPSSNFQWNIFLKFFISFSVVSVFFFNHCFNWSAFQYFYNFESQPSHYSLHFWRLILKFVDLPYFYRYNLHLSTDVCCIGTCFRLLIPRKKPAFKFYSVSFNVQEEEMKKC